MGNDTERVGKLNRRDSLIRTAKTATVLAAITAGLSPTIGAAAQSESDQVDTTLKDTVAPSTPVEVQGVAKEVPQALVDPRLADYIAGAEYMEDFTSFNSRILINLVPGSPVLLSPSVYQALAAELEAQGVQPTNEYISILASKSNWAPLLKKTVGSNANAIVVDQAGVFTFDRIKTPGRRWLSLITPGSEKFVEYPSDGNNPFSPAWDDNLGIAYSDGMRITGSYDPASDTWSGLDEYIIFGTPEQRIRHSLVNFLNKPTTERDGSHVNILGLDPEEVQTYLDTGEDQGLTTFQVLKNSEGKPAMIVTIGQPFGVKKENVDIAKKAVTRLNMIDPTVRDQEGNIIHRGIIDEITQRFGARAIAGNIQHGFETPPVANYFASYSASFGITEVNEIKYPATKTVNEMLYILLTEPRAIYGRLSTKVIPGTAIFVVTAPDKLDDNEGVDKGLWLAQWVERNKAKLTIQEDKFLTDGAKTIVDYYRANP